MRKKISPTKTEKRCLKMKEPKESKKSKNNKQLLN